jgi:peptidoglycan biosynthesis protein MviN/MurJ (putative lipid II flippase)
MVLLRRRLGGLEERRVARSFGRIVLASTAMAIAVAAVDAATATWLPGGSLIRQIVRLAASIAVALGVLSAAAHYLRIPEFREGAAMVMRKLRRAGT